MIKVDGLLKKYGRKTVIDHIDLHLENKTYALLGPNGAGKTTLLRCICGLIPINGGTIKGDNGLIGYLPQHFGAFKEMIVYDFLDYLCFLKKIDKKEREDEINRVLESVHLLDKSSDRCSTLSGGMIRRLGIAQSMLGNPDLIILDEPTTGLDIEERMHFKTIMSHSMNNTRIISTHIVEDIEGLADEILLLKDHKIELFNEDDFLKLTHNRVYEVPTSQVKENDFIISEYFNQNKQSISRIISDEDRGEPCEETLSDSYIYYFKGIK